MSSSISEILRLCNLNQIQQVISSFHSLNPTVLHNVGPNAFATLLHLCARHRLLAFGQTLHRHLPSTPLPTFLSNHLINMYSKCSRPDLARHVLDEMPFKNLVSWTALLTGYNQNGLHDDCFGVCAEMLRSNCVPNDFGFVGVLSSCSTRTLSRGRQGRQVHGVVFKVGFVNDVFVGNALISMYCRCYEDGDGQGWLLFRSMKWHNSITWNSMINGFSMNGNSRQSIQLFVCMIRNGINMDPATILGVLPSCSSLKSCRQLHGFAMKTSFVSEVEVATAFVKAYSASSSDVREDCYRVFSEARDHDTMSWTGIITSFADRDPETAILLFHRFRSEGLVPDRHTFSITVKACATMATERYGSALHSLILKSGFENDLVVSNALIHAYARCGNINLAESVFQRSSNRGLVTWNSMIKAYAMHGRGDESLKLFSTMTTAPDSTTFVGVLSACSHKGLISEAREIFRSMREVYGIAPDGSHYACMVDVLSRVGLIREAKDLIDGMAVEPDSVIWSTLLGACRKHREVTIGEYAGRKLMELQPSNSAGYVMMSNIYREGGSLVSAAFVRKGMKECGVRKTPGLSWIEVGNHVHEFAAGGRRHPRIEEVCAELKAFVGRLKKEKGYLCSAAEEGSEEEERVLMHGEKLAFVFGMMNLRSGEDCIRIMKNIRTCVDCHGFMKLASKLSGLEIVLRDTNRFHHFRDEVCSCGDYW